MPKTSVIISILTSTISIGLAVFYIIKAINVAKKHAKDKISKDKYYTENMHKHLTVAKVKGK